MSCIVLYLFMSCIVFIMSSIVLHSCLVLYLCFVLYCIHILYCIVHVLYLSRVFLCFQVSELIKMFSGKAGQSVSGGSYCIRLNAWGKIKKHFNLEDDNDKMSEESKADEQLSS